MLNLIEKKDHNLDVNRKLMILGNSNSKFKLKMAYFSMQTIPSISTNAPFGRLATPSAARAG